MVLEYKWAYGSEGNALVGKHIFQVVTTGGQQENYCKTGKDRFTIYELLEPFNQTAKVCKMHYLPPYVIHGTFSMQKPDYLEAGKQYGKLLSLLLEHPLDEKDFSDLFYLNEWFTKITLPNGN